MFRIHVTIISLMLACGIGSLLGGTIISYKTKPRISSSMTAAPEERGSEHKKKSDKDKAIVTTAHANVKKEETKVQQLNIFLGNIGTKSLPFSDEAVKMALWLQENLPVTITDWQSTSGEIPINPGTNMTSGTVSNSSYSEPLSSRKSLSNFKSPLSDLRAGTLSITLAETSTKNGEIETGS